MERLEEGWASLIRTERITHATSEVPDAHHTQTGTLGPDSTAIRTTE
jgi:hypothetical protein